MYMCLPPIRSTISSRCHRCRRDTGTPEPSSVDLPELGDPAAHGLITDVEPAFGKELLYVAIAQREAQVQPDGMLDHRRREAMASVREGLHRSFIPPAPGGAS
jgi:hypothetical protein